MDIRISYGSAVRLGLKSGRVDHYPTTLYAMVGERCESNCRFCSQRKSNIHSGWLSRVFWPRFTLSEVIDAYSERSDAFLRICAQTLDYPEMVDDLIHIADRFREITRVPISASIVPISYGDMERLRDAGYQTISIALDAATEEIFTLVKGIGVGNRFTFTGHLRAIQMAKEVFGFTYTHLIVGLGERDVDLVNIMNFLHGRGIMTSLFAYTPIVRDPYFRDPPPIERYRKIQLIRHLMLAGLITPEDIHYDSDGMITGIEMSKDEMLRHLNSGLLDMAFTTSGCPGCNRPYYNEKPAKHIHDLYNIPVKPPREIIRGEIERLNRTGFFIRQ